MSNHLAYRKRYRLWALNTCGKSLLILSLINILIPEKASVITDRRFRISNSVPVVSFYSLQLFIVFRSPLFFKTRFPRATQFIGNLLLFFSSSFLLLLLVDSAMLLFLLFRHRRRSCPSSFPEKSQCENLRSVRLLLREERTTHS